MLNVRVIRGWGILRMFLMVLFPFDFLELTFVLSVSKTRILSRANLLNSKLAVSPFFSATVF